jgi:hypothetical protein
VAVCHIAALVIMHAPVSGSDIAKEDNKCEIFASGSKGVTFACCVLQSLNELHTKLGTEARTCVFVCTCACARMSDKSFSVLKCAYRTHTKALTCANSMYFIISYHS